MDSHEVRFKITCIGEMLAQFQPEVLHSIGHCFIEKCSTSIRKAVYCFDDALLLLAHASPSQSSDPPHCTSFFDSEALMRRLIHFLSYMTDSSPKKEKQPSRPCLRISISKLQELLLSEIANLRIACR